MSLALSVPASYSFKNASMLSAVIALLYLYLAIWVSSTTRRTAGVSEAGMLKYSRMLH